MSTTGLSIRRLRVRAPSASLPNGLRLCVNMAAYTIGNTRKRVGRPIPRL